MISILFATLEDKLSLPDFKNMKGFGWNNNCNSNNWFSLCNCSEIPLNTCAEFSLALLSIFCVSKLEKREIKKPP